MTDYMEEMNEHIRVYSMSFCSCVDWGFAASVYLFNGGSVFLFISDIIRGNIDAVITVHII